MIPRIVWRFPSDGGTASCATADPDFPASNVLLPHVNEAESLKDDGTSTAFRVVVDFGAAYTVGAFIAHGHDIPNTATGLKVQANTADSWGSPAYTHNCTWAADKIEEYFTGQTYRYWSFTLTKASAATIITLARILFGQDFQLVQAPSERSVEWGGEEETRTERTPGGASYSDVAAHLKTLSFSIEFMAQTQKDELSALSETMGLHSPFVISLDPDGIGDSCFIYGKLTRKIRFRDRVWNSQTLYDCDISVIEEK